MKKRVPRKKALGRPIDGTVYRPELCSMLIEHMRKGYSYYSFAHIADVNIDTLYDWETRHEEWKAAKAKAFAANFYYWDKKLIESMETNQPFNNTAYVFAMKTRFKIGLDTARTVVQIKNEVASSGNNDHELIQEFKDIMVQYVDERKEPA